ncbi:DNA ligase D-like 3'-phosphoesterase domain-containing protein [Candidatus Methanoperedens nitroreducens]|uniref:DNA ligase D-like 3'-phosphoesterase domain-containing protein n=1 Tax=Candidatus Methanoperedens nitratireducens TaxID=1392998 RepID=A0A062VBF5_9EURY|nr:DNA polymerase ligase N-terminal domain-containing protein [Candidatus Methanoperedens nitroreducens]KCZ72645.1 DNA ligase D-like 3'-phosphoesterase domain-containing protein [Candidatus Methanoperedens nitroreducens]MDJ1423423.1 DNA polymerase ligase N-terminal domain-containing protein [Candidatus Methanoperedens sp.]
MSLDEYQRLRDFTKSPEPKGSTKKSAGSIFVVHEHHATHLHYDLRLEMGGVLRSWAVPKEPPEKEGVKRLAIQTEDHPLEYADFEGTIPEGMYGAGAVRIWDKGEFSLEEEKEDRLLFLLKGRKLIGRYALIKTKFKGKDSWLLFKRKP